MGSLLGVYSTWEMVNFVRPVAPTRFANPPRGTRELGMEIDVMGIKILLKWKVIHVMM